MTKIFGIAPKHVLEIPFGDLTPEEFLIVALETARDCNWQILFITRSGFRAYTSNTLISSGEILTLQLQEGAASLSSESNGKQLLNSGKNKRNTDQFLARFLKLKESFDKITLHHKYEEWQQKFSSGDEPILASDPQSRPAPNSFFKILKPIEGYFITPILINLNGLILILMCMSGANILWPDANMVITWGGNFKPFTLNGEWWRMITCNFLHFGIIHLFFNMSALIYIGMILEPQLGKLKFLMAYLLTGITSSLCSLWWHDNAVSAGASGAIFGMYGVFFALLTTNFIEKEGRMTTLKSIGLFVVYNLAFGAALGADNAGHIGGLLGGLFLGYCFYFILIHPGSRALQAAILVLSAVSILGLAIFAYSTISNDLGVYLKKMEAFDLNEKKAVESYAFKANPESIQNIKNGIGLWKKNITLLEEAERLNLRAELKIRIKLMIKYCEARIKFYELALSDLQGGNFHESRYEQYNTEIGGFVQAIEAMDKKN